MKEFCYPSTKSTTAKIKQFFSHFIFVCSFFLFFFPSLLMENLLSRFEPLDEESHDLELECFEDFQDRRTEGEKLKEGSANGKNPTKQDDIIKTQSLRYSFQQRIISHTLSDLGSARKEKEWRRTLACKLYQERHNVGGGEGMDMLWEVYEKTEEENRGKQRQVSDVKEEEKSKIIKSRIVDYLEEDEEEEAEDSNLCCLKALRFSAGKMQFGMAKPGILNLNTAFKGIKPGWFSHHRLLRNRKKKV